jgi:murein DD-endopeptidase MepM/ murein hydrolase activator NlpD
MAKRKYFFDPNTLSYHEARRGFWYYLWRGLGVFSFSLTLAFALFIFFSGIFDSPKESRLRKENHELRDQLQILERQAQRIEDRMEKLSSKDADIYRTIFEAEPVKDKVFATFEQSIEKYAPLKKLKGSDFLLALRHKMDVLDERTKYQETSFEEVLKLAQNKRKLLSAIPSIQPVANKNLKKLASGYGFRIDPFYRTRKFHSGIDFSAPKNTEVYATADGVVELIQSDIWGYGKHIEINHGYGYKTLYAHLNKFEVTYGEKVKRGQLIGRLGSTGKSTAPHLHYEVRINGQPVNPAYFFHNDLNDVEFKRLIELSSSPNQAFD